MSALATPTGTPSSLRRSHRVRGLLAQITLLGFVLLTIYPIFFLLNVSAKSRLQFERNPLAIELPKGWYAYPLAWEVVRSNMLNTVIITTVSLIGLLITASITAYVFARYSFPGKELLWYGLLGLLMIPGILTMVPLLVLVVQLSLINTLWAAILPYVAGGQAFNIFLMRTFIAGLPEELFEAARIDGAGHFSLIFRLVMPLAMPILVVVSILHVLHSWNDIAWPLLTLNSANVRPIALQLLQFQSPTEEYPTAQFAGAVIASIPLFAIFFIGMRQFVSGVITGALKL
jgi:ABC-type glycerol-3-phosphate transport system permease component